MHKTLSASKIGFFPIMHNSVDKIHLQMRTSRRCAFVFAKLIGFAALGLPMLHLGIANAQSEPAISSPAAGTTLPAGRVTISWAGNGLSEDVIQYFLSAGPTPGSNEYYKGFQQTNLSKSVPNLPNDGSAVFFQLKYQTADGWSTSPAVEYQASNSLMPAITSPAPNSMLDTRGATINWNGNDLDNEVLQYNLRVGSTPGGSDYYNRNQGLSTSQILTGLPDDGRALFIQLRYQTIHGWSKTNPIEYIASKDVLPSIISPTSGTILPTGRVTISWTGYELAEEVIQYFLSAGPTPGSDEYYKGFQQTNLSKSIPDLPNDGTAVFFQLRYQTASGWNTSPAIEYQASNSILPAITSPAPSSTLDARGATINWTGNDLDNEVLQYNLRVGSTPGGSDYYNRNQGPNTSRFITDLPDNGQVIYVQLRYQTINGWSKTSPIEYKASENVLPQITSPAPSTVLPGGRVTISWTGNGLTDDVTQYFLSAGPTPGSDEYYKGFQQTSLSKSIPDLPNDGSAVFFQLKYLTADGWSTSPSVEYQASSSLLPAITSPAPSSVLDESGTTITWNGNDLSAEVLQYNLRVGSTPGGSEYYNRNQGLNTSIFLTDLPDDSQTIYIQLRYQTSNGWSKTQAIEYSALSSLGFCGALTTNTESFTIPSIAKPTFKQAYQDPAFNSSVIRISNASFGDVVKPMYSTIQAWNADESLMILYKTGNGSSGHMLYDGNTYEPISQIDITPADIEQIFWSHTDPDEFFYISNSASDLGEFKRYSVSEKSSSYITDFKQYCGDGIVPTAGNDAHMPSLDDDLFAFRCEKDDGTHIMLSYRVSTDETITQPIGEGTSWEDNIAPTPAPSGERFWYQGYVLGTDLETIENSLDLFKPNEHSNIGMTHSGNDALYQIAFNESPNGCNGDLGLGIGHLVEHNLETGTCRSIVNEKQGYPYSTSASHVSAQAYRKPGLVAMSSVGTIEQMEEFFTGETPASALFSEIYLTNTDPENPATCRLAHHRSFGKLATNGGYPPYFGEPHVTISPSGTRILFGSDWYDSGSVDAYVIELPSYSN